MHKTALAVNVNVATSEPTSAFERVETLTWQLHHELVDIQQWLVPVAGREPLALPPAFGSSLLERYAELTTLDATLNAEQRMLARVHHRTLVQPMFLSVPLIRRSVDRPLGYPGDYVMVEMIFGHGPAPGGPLAALLEGAVLESAPSRAHRYRAPWAHGWLDTRAAELQRPLRILSFACGPELVLRSYFKHAAHADVVLCDHERRALVHAETKLAPALREQGSLSCVQLSAVNLLRGAAKRALLQGPASTGFDAVLVLGLFDYLSDGLVHRMVRTFHTLMRPGGLLLTSNLSLANPHRSLMEYVADWHVLHRSEADFERLMLADTGFEREQLISDPDAANLLFAGRARAS